MAMRFLQNKNKVKGSSVKAENSLILKLASLFLDSENSSLIIREPMCVEWDMQERRESKRCVRERGIWGLWDWKTEEGERCISL